MVFLQSMQVVQMSQFIKEINEFKVKDDRGNWRAISTIMQGKYLVMVYAFHKKSQELLEKDKDVIKNRIKRIEI